MSDPQGQPDSGRPDSAQPDSAQPDSGHLDLDGLADRLAGQVDAGPHLSTCGGCSARLAELAAADHLVVTALRSLPQLALPDDVAERLSARLAGRPSQGADRVVVPLTGRRRPLRMAPVAAGLALFAGALLGYTLLAPGSTGPAATGVAAPAATDTGDALATRTLASGLDYADSAAVDRALPAVLDGTAVPGTGVPGPGVPGPGGPRREAGGPAGEDQAGPGPGRAVPPDPLDRLRDPAALADCLAAALGPGRGPTPGAAAPAGRRPLALDYASYAGAPALAVVLADTDPRRVTVLVVGPACTRTDDDRRSLTRLARP